MVAHTPKYGLAVEEPADPSDMPAASARSAATVEAALDRVASGAAAVAAGKINRSGDTMTGKLTAPQVQVAQGADVGYELGYDSGGRFALLRAGFPILTVDTGGVVTILKPLHPDGGMVVSDTAIPAAAGAPAQFRWLVYDQAGQVQRVNDAQFRILVASIAAASTRTLKRDIGDPGPAPDLSRLAPRRFQWDAGKDEAAATTRPGVRYGLIAEEAAAVDERLVTVDGAGQVAGLDVNALVAALVAQVQALSARIDVLEGER